MSWASRAPETDGGPSRPPAWPSCCGRTATLAFAPPRPAKPGFVRSMHTWTAISCPPDGPARSAEQFGGYCRVDLLAQADDRVLRSAAEVHPVGQQHRPEAAARIYGQAGAGEPGVPGAGVRPAVAHVVVPVAAQPPAEAAAGVEALGLAAQRLGPHVPQRPAGLAVPRERPRPR